MARGRLALASAAFLFALAAFSVPSHATLIFLGASLDGAQETPPVPTPATGVAWITYDTDTNLLSWTIQFKDLVGPTNNAHFHGPAEIGVPAGVRVPIPFNAGVTHDTLMGSATITDTDETELLGGLWYINIHTTFRPGGEIRGQVLAPEPGTLLLLGAGVALLAARVRR